MFGQAQSQVLPPSVLISKYDNGEGGGRGRGKGKGKGEGRGGGGEAGSCPLVVPFGKW